MSASASGLRRFVVIWCGQSVSMVGSSLTGFALGIHIYELTGSATRLGFVFAFALLPSILASPFAGSVVDRWGPRRALIVSNAGNTIVISVLAVLLFTHALAVWHVYVIVAAMSALSALENPAFAALTPQLVPKRYLGQANGMRVAAMAASEVLAPVTAGFLLAAIGISGIVLIDVLSWGPAMLTLLSVPVPDASPARPASSAPRVLLAEFWEGWRYVAARRGLLVLLLFLAAVNFSAGFIDLLITPLVLAFASPAALGTVLSIGGVGMIATSLATGVRGGPRRRVRAILVSSLVLAAATVVGSSRPRVALVAVAAFFFMGALGVIISTNQTIWQTKVEPHLLGRVMAVLTMVSSAPQLLAYVVAGVIVDRVFEPLVGRDHVRSHVVAAVVGSGAGRGIALLMMIMGILIAFCTAGAAANKRLRRLEDELPDVSPEADDPAAEPDPARA